MRREPVIDRVMRRLTLDANDCWIFHGSLTTKGYGHIKVGRSMRPTHRVTYEFFVGPIPDGLVLDHLCRVRDCCNPDHLEPVTNRENYLRGVRRSRTTHCPYGHPYDEANTYVHINREGQRRRACRTCRATRKVPA